MRTFKAKPGRPKRRAHPDTTTTARNPGSRSAALPIGGTSAARPREAELTPGAPCAIARGGSLREALKVAVDFSPGMGSIVVTRSYQFNHSGNFRE